MRSRVLNVAPELLANVLGSATIGPVRCLDPVDGVRLVDVRVGLTGGEVGAPIVQLLLEAEAWDEVGDLGWDSPTFMPRYAREGVER